MALSTLTKEQDNFLRYAILIVDHSKEALQDLIELNLRNKHLSFEEFLNQNQHEIYHLCNDSKCCQCHTSPPRRKRIICPPQLELLFDKHNKLSCHKATHCSDFCCSKSKVGITTEVLDISLARCLLLNCCLDVFWFTCLTAHGQTLEQFLNLNKHIIYHLWKNNQKCCQCPAGYIIQRDYPIITENEWRCMFNSVLMPCINDRKRTSTGTTSVCSVAARPGIDVKDIHPEIQGLILKWCCSVRKGVEKLVEFRNINFGHVTNAKLTESTFKDFSKKTEECILDIASFCGKHQKVKDAVTNLHSRPIDARLCSHYQNILLENINRNEAINENINLQHRTTRQSIPRLVDKSCKMRKMEKRIDALEISNAEIKEDIQDIYKLVKEGPKRQRLIDQTSAEIDSYKKEGTYLETEAVRQCIQLLECRNVVIISGREGSGKSRNSLEILRQLKERHNDLDVFKLVGLHYVSDIVKCNVTCIVLFDDAFDKTSEHFSYEEHVLNHLYSYISQNKVKVIFTMRNYVRHACHSLLSTHKIFRDFVDIDLNSKKFKLTNMEKEKMITNYCVINKIMISEGKEDNTDQSVSNKAGRDDNEAFRSVQDQAVVILKRKIMNEIIETDPFPGFPECCRLFTENRNNATLDVSCFKWPSIALVNDIEKLRMEGINNYINGLKYVILIVILTKGYSILENKRYLFRMHCTLVDSKLDEEDCKQIFNKCYNMDVEVRKSDIEHVCKVLTERYLLKRDGTYCFQHKAIQDSVLISYSRINLEAIIPLLSFDHLVDIVRPQNYTEQENEVVIKISKPYYPKLATEIILSCLFPYNHWYPNNLTELQLITETDRLTESKLITENDTDLVYQLILSIENDKNTYKNRSNGENICYFIPLFLLRNIGKLDDKMLTVNHTKDEMLISFTIRDKEITLSIHPEKSLGKAFLFKQNDIFKWLLKYTDHSLLNIMFTFVDIRRKRVLEYTKLLLDNVKHNMFDFTQLFISVCQECENREKHAVDWIVDNVDNSLIRYIECIEIMSMENRIDIIIYLLEKVNHRWLNFHKVVELCCKFGRSEIVEWALENFDHELNDKMKVELINITINGEEENYIVHDDHTDCNCFIGYSEILLLLLPRINYNSIDINGVMNDVCDSGHSPAIMWLLENKRLYRFNMRTVMNKACHHGDIKLVEYLYQIYNEEDFDYKTAMIKACRHTQCNTLDVCKWLWKNIDHSVFDMKAALNNASRCDNTKVMEWILTDIDKGLYDTESAILFACENGEEDTVELLLEISCVNMIDIQSAMIIACRNEDNGLSITELLYECDDHSTIDINVVFSAACKNLRIDIVQWIIETCDQNITVIETMDGNKHLIESLDKNLIDIDRAFTCIFNMDTPDQNKENDNETKNKLVRLILNKSDPSIVHIYKLLAETCKNDWVDIFQWILVRVDNASLNIGEIINVACHNGAFDIIKWSLENIDIHLIDVDNVMVESCGFGWLECVVLIWKHCDNYKLQAAMTEACTYGRLHIAEWLLINAHCLFDIPMLLQEAGRNGWINIFGYFLQNVHFDKSDMHNATSQALEHGHLEIAELGITKLGKEGFDVSSLSENTYVGANKEGVVNFLLHNFDPKSIDIATIMTNACLFGWKDIATFIVDNDFSSRCDLSLALNTACDNGELEIVQLLLDKVDPHILTTVDKAMHSVALKGWDEIAVLLLDIVEHTRLDIGNAFIEACRYGEIDIVQAIIRKVDINMLDVNTALNEACAHHMHEELVLWILENTDHKQLDLKNVKIKADRHHWRTTQFAIAEVDTEEINQVEQDTETDYIVIP